MSDTFVVGSTTLDPTTDDFIPLRFSERFGTIPTLTLQRRGIALPGLPDPWIGKAVTWTLGSTLRFTGDVVSAVPSYTAVGWTITYQCLGFRNRLDFFPHTDSNSGTDTSTYNLTLEDPDYIAARAGRTVGDILTDVLTMLANATAIDAQGLGGYTSLSPPTLPTATTDDLALLTIIVPRPVYFTGERFGGAIDGFLQQWAPNHRFWVGPDGVFRFLDLRTFTAQTLTMGTDPIEPTELSRDTADCFQRVEVRGQPIAIMGFLKQSLGQLDQNFTWGSYTTNADAIAAWDPSQFRTPGAAQDVGTCTCPSTTTITVTSSDTSVTWVANYWDQTHQQGTVNLYSTTTTGVTQIWSARIVSNTALTAGGTSTLTIDNPLPALAYDNYTITGLATGGSVVWTQYQIHDSDLWPKVVRQSTYPQAFVSSGGGSAMLLSTALGMVLWSSDGSPPYNSFPLGFTYNPTTGNVRFNSPTYFTANNSAPSDVWVALPMQTNPNLAVSPADVAGVAQYSGTSHTVDGWSKTLTIDAPYWRDPGQLSQVLDYAASVLDSVSEAVCEGSVVYYGLFEDALTFGLALDIAGDDGDGAYTTGWEDLELPVIGVDIEWPQGEGMDYRTTMHCSNRRQALSSAMFMHPEQTSLLVGGTEGFYNPFGLSQPDTTGASQQGNYEAMGEKARNGELNTGGLASGMEGVGESPSFSLEDQFALGQDTGGGVQDNATDPNRKQKKTPNTLPNTKINMPRTGPEIDRIANLGNHAQDVSGYADLGKRSEPEDLSPYANLGNQSEDLSRFADLGKQQAPEPSDAERDRIANLGKHPEDLSRYRNLGKPDSEPSDDEKKRIASLGKPDDEDES